MVIASFLPSRTGGTPWTTEETPVAEVARIMAATGLGTIPVLDRDGRLVGLVFERDILRLTAERRIGIRGMAVTEIMTREVTTLGAEDPAESAFHAFVKAGARHVAVCDNDGRLLGLLGIDDLMRITLAPTA